MPVGRIILEEFTACSQIKSPWGLPDTFPWGAENPLLGVPLKMPVIAGRLDVKGVTQC